MELNKIYQGDSIGHLKNMVEKSVQLVVTSPPYYAFKDYGDDEQNVENFASYSEYIDYFKEWFKELFRVVDDDGRVCIVVDDKHTNLKTEGENKSRGTHARFIMLAEEAGFIYKDLIVWVKARTGGHPSGGAGYMLGSYPYPPNIPFVNWFEYILIFRKDGVPRVTKVSTEQKEKSKITFNEFKWAAVSLWEIPAEKGTEHPCPYPEEIPRRLVKLFSFYGDTVLDPFCGSGTTAMVSKSLGRNYIGIELNPNYCKDSKLRLTQSLLTS